MYLDDMIEAAGLVIEFARGFDMATFSVDRRTRDAVIRNLEVLGEAAKKLTDDVRSMDDTIPWRRIMGMRDVLAHDYFGIDDHILWDVVSVEIPRLLLQLTALKDRMNKVP
jgi:uncharacterized protein with HEPN domain